MRRKSLHNLLLIALLTLFVAEVGCRLVMPQPGFLPFAADHVAGLKISHPTRGFAYAPGFSGQRITEDFTHSIRINALGLRDRDLGAEELDGPTILALGNSFTAGIGVEFEATHRQGGAVRFPKDAHWTPLGNRIVAESLRQALSEAPGMVPNQGKSQTP